MNLTELAADLSAHLDEAFPDRDRVSYQGLAVAEETGEFVGALRRYKGLARRRGTFEELCEEWADVVLTAYITAYELGIDPDKAIASKVDKIYSRGWRE